jgi:hypothetical protein
MKTAWYARALLKVVGGKGFAFAHIAVRGLFRTARIKSIARFHTGKPIV